MKLWLGALIALGCLGALFFFNAQSPTANHNNLPGPRNSSISTPFIKIFNPSEVTHLTWSEDGKSLDLKKKGEKWESKSYSLSPDPWSIQRRLQLLSELRLSERPAVGQAIGTFSIQSQNKTFSGAFDRETLVLTNGPQKGNGVALNENPTLKSLLDEGLLGFQSHVLNFCGKNSSLEKIDFLTWSLEKRGGHWRLVEGEKQQSVKPEAVHALEITLCSLRAENYVRQTLPSEGATLVLTLGLSNGVKPVAIKQVGAVFYPEGLPAFQSQALLEILKSTHAVDLEDPVLNDAKIAVDHNQEQNDRLAAIRRMKTSTSPQAIAALKEILFEKTEIDLYRYEAVDSLAAIGTKEAFKLINDRLAQVGRSGFELRMARALSAAMGRFFRSDEKTPEEVRRPEVDELIQAAKEHPPGK